MAHVFQARLLHRLPRRVEANYSPLKDHAEQVARQFQEEIDEGLMLALALRKALAIFGLDLLIAATRAIAKKVMRPSGDVRVVFEGSNSATPLLRTSK